MNKTIMFLGMLAVGFANAQQTNNYDGKVGINTETPSATLNVKSKTGTTATTKNFELENAANKKLMTVLDDGKTGVGTDTPKEKLHVVGGIRSEVRTSSGIGGYLYLVNPSKSGSGNEAKVANWRLYNMGDSYPNGLHFYGYPEDEKSAPIIGLDPLMALADNGKVGIGINNPSEKLHIRGGNMRIENLPSSEGISTNRIVVVDNHGVLKSIEKSTLTGSGSAVKAIHTPGIQCVEEKLGSINFGKVTVNGKPQQAFGFCTKDTNGTPIWAYIIAGNNMYSSSNPEFGQGL